MAKAMQTQRLSSANLHSKRGLNLKSRNEIPKRYIKAVHRFKTLIRLVPRFRLKYPGGAREDNFPKGLYAFLRKDKGPEFTFSKKLFKKWMKRNPWVYYCCDKESSSESAYDQARKLHCEHAKKKQDAIPETHIPRSEKIIKPTSHSINHANSKRVSQNLVQHKTKNRSTKNPENSTVYNYLTKTDLSELIPIQRTVRNLLPKVLEVGKQHGWNIRSLFPKHKHIPTPAEIKIMQEKHDERMKRQEQARSTGSILQCIII